MVGTVLFMFLMSIFMMGIGQFWQLTLDDAVRNATRQIETTSVSNSTQFVTSVCNEFGLAITNCTTSLQYSVEIGPSFSALGTPPTVNATGALAGGNQFTGVAAAGDAILVKVAFKMPVTIPLIPPAFVTENGTPAFISANAAMVEP
jgi:hypothetical protein